MIARITLALVVIAVVTGTILAARIPTAPYVKGQIGRSDYEYAGQITVHPWTRRTLRVIGDDCVMALRVNGRQLPTLDVRGDNGCIDANTGSVVDLSDYLHDGTNDIVAIVRNIKGEHALIFAAAPPGPFETIVFAIFSLACFALAAMLYRAIGVPRSLLPYFGGALVLTLAYALTTPFSERAPDAWGHIEYMRYLAFDGRAPDANACWQCYHPPLFHAFAAPFYRVAHSAWLFDPRECMQILSVFLFGIFYAFALKTIHYVLADSARAHLCALFLGLMPMSAMQAIQVGNDRMLWALWAAGFFFLARWFDRVAPRDLWAACICAALGLLAKGNGVILFALIAVAVALRACRYRSLAIVRRVWPQFMILGASLVAYILWSRSFIRSGITGNVNRLPLGMRIDNTWQGYCFLDSGTFFTEFARPFDDSGGRQFYWNYFLKTLSIGDWFYDDPHMVWLSRILVAIFLPLVLVASALIVLRARRLWRRLPLFVAAAAATPIFSIAYRLVEGFACSTHARYVWPGVIAFATLSAASLDEYGSRGRILARVLAALALAFVIASVVFHALMLFEGSTSHE